jgi:hypothetical protein
VVRNRNSHGVITQLQVVLWVCVCVFEGTIVGLWLLSSSYVSIKVGEKDTFVKDDNARTKLLSHMRLFLEWMEKMGSPIGLSFVVCL